MQRRGFLAAVATACAGSVAGCSILSGSSGPKAVAKQFVRASHNGNEKEQRRLAHPEHTMMQQIEQGIYGPPEGSVSIQSMRKDRRSETFVNVRVEYRLSTGGETQQRSMNVDLVRHDGNWRVSIVR